MKSHIGRAFIPSAIFRAQYESFSTSKTNDSGTQQGAGRRITLGVFYGVPVVLFGLSIALSWTFLAEVSEALITGAALVGTVLIAVSAVVLQILLAESQRPGYTESDDAKRVRALRNIHGLVASGAVFSLALVAAMIWLRAITPTDVSYGTSLTFSLVHSASLALLAYSALTLIRVLIATDAVAAAYAHRAATRV